MKFGNFHLELDSNFAWRLLFALCTISIIVGSYDTALAAPSASAGNDIIGATLCRLVQNLSGGIARGIATMAIFAVGVGLFLGKVRWDIAAITAVGVGIIFSAPKLVAFLSGDANDSSCPT